MQVGYSGKTLVPNYSCVRGNQLYGTKRCQSVGGRRIERVVLDAVFEALRPAGIEATLRAIEHATSDHHDAGALGRAGARARADPRRARPPPVRRLRAGEPARRAHARARVGAAARRRPPRRARRRRRRRATPGPADRRGDRMVPARRRGPAQGVRRADDQRPRAQAAAARDPHRRRRDRRPRIRAARRRAAGRVGGRRHHRAHRAAVAHRQPHALHRPGHDRARAPARRALPRQADRRDPRPPRTAAPAPATRSPPTTCTACAPTTRSPPLPSDRPLTMARWSRSRKPPTSSTCPPRPCTAGCAKGSSPASRSPPARPGRSGSPTSSAPASASTHPTGGCRSPQAADALGVARQTVLHKVQRGELAAVYVHRGKRKGLRIQVKPDQTGLFENHIRQEAQC